MKELIEERLASALDTLKTDGLVPADVTADIVVTRTRDPSHGDFASNLAMVLARPAGCAPREIAAALVAAIGSDAAIHRIDIAGPGFINFHLADDAQSAVIAEVLEAGETYGRSEVGAGTRVQVEFVSANPTGPLHVGHGRGAAIGATLGNILAATGHEVQREYYVNDAGRQMNILALSVWLRYLEQRGETLRFPDNGYRGDYIREIAAELAAAYGDDLRRPAAEIFDGIPPDAADGGDKEVHVDALIERMRALVGDDYRLVFDTALANILDDIKADLGEFGVHYDNWFSERSLADAIPGVIAKLDAAGHLYEKDGVTWFRSTAFGDDKDRAVIRANGQSTYFASDIAYIDNKLERGLDRIIYCFGADHHGYTTRLYAACEALGHAREKLEFMLIQFAILYRGAERVQMSTRSGSFVTIRELRNEVGTDAARWFYVMRKYSQHLDFDLELAASQSSDNPVYYVQYAHARICSVLRQLEQRGLAWNREAGLRSLARLVEPQESELMTLLAYWPEVLERAALAREPHQVTGYLRDLANALHTFYNAHKVIVDDEALRDARLALLLAVRQVLANGLKLVGVSTPEVM
ncbi:MAG: arginine--tRNA ligase [Gammaproteobacteria bacterium]|nr:MAG: arginine--tRNA ligase [Gammaproteobacteria bacterium]